MSSAGWFDGVKDLTLALVRTPSVNGSADEVRFAGRLRDIIAQDGFPTHHGDELRVVPIPGDPWRRSNVIGLVRGEGRRTVLLCGHYDVVSTANYGELEPWACDPEALAPRLIEALAGAPPGTLEALALTDLQSGDFLPGRGALDMKSGLAAGIAVLRHFASERPPGNLLLLATPDEEVNSAGMRAAREMLPELAREWELELTCAVNVDSESDHGDGGQGRSIFLGSVGKLLPFVHVVGRESHAGEPLGGVSATLLAAEVVRSLEWSPDLVEGQGAEASPLPALLKVADTKGAYDVTTPAAVWLYLNVLSHTRRPSEVLDWARSKVERSLQKGLQEAASRAAAYARLTGTTVVSFESQPLVLTYSELYARAGGLSAHAADWGQLRSLTEQPGLDGPERSRRMVEFLWQRSGLVGPGAVVGFASLAYPAASLEASSAGPFAGRFREIVDREARAAGEWSGSTVKLRGYFPGVSDMSFLAYGFTDADVAVLAENTPAWDLGLAQPKSGDFALPVVNIGPWGRDPHLRLERVHARYAFETVPELVWRVALAALAG
ncbi:MAG: M20/M25/M40 family metallo-hydrolase [Candidatus Dormibacter sp.]|uniref:M20/M25/M40 family metallo-hydrolase n=1 Tax=Candidatus Dormibacter sp. TaxID=2973982 RepID=UPI000DB89D48|nr:MAG: hypothetical protein DLM66_14570 [Candidatus Dormibacteraeota bacterium]